VVETSRKEMATPPPKQFEKLELTKSGTVALLAEKKKTSSPIHDVDQLGFSDDASVEFIRRSDPEELSFVRLTSTGALDFDTDLRKFLPPRDASFELFDLSGDRWLMQVDKLRPAWVELDVKSGTARP